MLINTSNTSARLAITWVSIFAMLLAPLPYARAQKTSDAPPPEQPQGTDQEQPAPETPAATRLGPKYLNLRYDEDFSYLDGEPDGYNRDLFDPIKNIHLGDDWRLTLGGEFRFQMQSETNKAFGATEPANDTFQLYRFMMHADLKYRDALRIFAQGIMAFDEDRDLVPRAIDENRWDLHQLFADVKLLNGDFPLTLRVGRQELRYGNERYVSPLEWANVRRRFDGVKLFGRTELWDVDVWWVRPVPVQRKHIDDWDQDVDFYGVYTTYKGIPRHGIDLYFFALDDSGNRTNPNGRAGDRNIYTLGSRFWGKTANFDYEAELAGQGGHWAGDSVQAWSVSLDGGYTFANTPSKPRIGAGFDWASGDDDASDGAVGTFDQLFPLAHKYFGFLDLFGRQNITAVNANLSVWAVPDTVKVRLAYHAFWLSEKNDAIYGVAGTPGRRDATGDSGRELGHEIDVTLQWRLDVHSSLLFGYSHFWDGTFIQQTGLSENADLFYIQYAIKF